MNLKKKIVSFTHCLVPSSNERFFDLSLCMMLIILLLYMRDAGGFTFLIPLLAVSGLLLSPLRHNKYLWLAFLLILSYFYVYQGLSVYVPNHKYLFTFFCLLIVVFLFSKKDSAVHFHYFQ